MPLYLDIHRLPEAVDPEVIREAHTKDVAVQDRFGVSYQGYWYNLAGRTVACMVHGPSREICEEVHRQAHGLMAEQIIEVNHDLMQAFLGGGTINDAGEARLPEGELDPGVRVLLLTELDNLAAIGVAAADDAVLQLVERHDRIVRAAMARHGGREVRHMGDGLMLSFPLASAAVNCAMDIQREAATGTANAPGRPFVRIGIAAGEPVSRYATLFGTTVEQSRLLCRTARPGEVLVSTAVRDLCQGKGFAFSSTRAVHAVGLTQPVEMAALLGHAGAEPIVVRQEPRNLDRLGESGATLASRYVIEREIDRGGMAVVYVGRDLRHARRVAVKVLRPELGSSIGSARFLEEIRVAAGLTHPNIVPLHDSGEDDGLLYYVMPYLEGESLRRLLVRERRLPLPRVIEIATALAAGLEHAHRQGVVHRDIKPENIMMLDGIPLILDFGIALALSQAGAERLTLPGLALGTPAYMSPEQASGDVVDAFTDTYALGSVVYEMLVGEAPFSAPSVPRLMARIITDPPPRPAQLREDIPEHVDRAVERALAKVPGERFATPREFAAALARA